MKSHWVLVGLMPLLIAAGQDQKSEQARLQGSWQAVSIVENGKEATAESVKTSQLIIKENQFVFKGDESYRGTFTLDPSKEPKWIDTTFIDEDSKEKGKALGIYQLSGEQLKISWRHKGNDRPDDFTSKPGSGVRSIVLKRQAK
jgi:uncharacterized protein (TIGR03067 family)